MSRGIICDKCGKAWKPEICRAIYPNLPTEEVDDFIASRGLDLCLNCMKEYNELFVKPLEEIHRKRLEWLNL